MTAHTEKQDANPRMQAPPFWHCEVGSAPDSTKQHKVTIQTPEPAEAAKLAAAYVAECGHAKENDLLTVTVFKHGERRPYNVFSIRIRTKFVGCLVLGLNGDEA